MDDQLLLGRSQSHVDRQMRIFRRLGIDRVRVSAFWNGATSASAGSATKPAGFDTSNPNDPQLLLGRPGPGRGLRPPPRDQGDALHHHARPALGQQRRGAALDPGRASSPPTRRPWPGATPPGWTTTALANEPNQPGWLRPQTDWRRPGLARTSTACCSRRPTRGSRPPTPARSCWPATSPPAAWTGLRRPRASARWPSCARWPAWTAACGRSPAVAARTSGPCPPTPSATIPTSSSARLGSGPARATTPRSVTAGASLRLLDRLQARGRIVKPTRRAVLGLLHGVRLPDRSPRPVRGDLAAKPQPLPPRGRLPRLAHPPAACLQPVPPHRRTAAPRPRPAPLRGVPERPPVRQPAQEAEPTAPSPTRSSSTAAGSGARCAPAAGTPSGSSTAAAGPLPDRQARPYRQRGLLQRATAAPQGPVPLHLPRPQRSLGHAAHPLALRASRAAAADRAQPSRRSSAA